jgi:hypothetical protein
MKFTLLAVASVVSAASAFTAAVSSVFDVYLFFETYESPVFAVELASLFACFLTLECAYVPVYIYFPTAQCCRSIGYLFGNGLGW